MDPITIISLLLGWYSVIVVQFLWSLLYVKDPKQIEGVRQVVKTQQFIGLFVCQIADIELDL